MNSKIPTTMYGTAWKEDATAELTYQALKAGFRAIDTANQRKHYFEEAVGQGVVRFLNETAQSASSPIKREDLFLQTKFTFARGQDHRKPYDENDSFTKQVADSFQSSLKHLQTNYVDSYVLHGPSTRPHLIDADFETWAAMETIYQSQKARYLGVSNFTAEQLIELIEQVQVQPTFVQNRCFARFGWDKAVRDICRSKGIYYQGFSLLTANAVELSDEKIRFLAQKYQKTIPQIVFRFCQQNGMIYLTGTSNPMHMQQDLNLEDFSLTNDELALIENIAF